MLKTSLFLGILSFFALAPLWAQNKKTNVKVKYKKHTEFDFAGERIEGKLKTPSVFYIFQRKRSEGHHLVSLPERLNFSDDELASITRRALKK